MAVRKIVQDSDDEEDSDRGAPSASKVPHQQSGIIIVNLENSSAGHTTVRSAEPSTGSTEALTREILNAQKSLLDLTPSGKTSDAIVSQPITTTQSSTMSKLKRRQTTGGTPDSNRKRLPKTYGAKASKDDFDFDGSSDEGGDIVSRKRQKHDNGSVGQVVSSGRHENESYSLGNSASYDALHERQVAEQENDTTAEVDNDTIITAASRAKKGRAMSLSVIGEANEVTTSTQTTGQGVRDNGAEFATGGYEMPSGDSATKKKRSRRRLTTHYSSSAAQQDASMVQSGVMSGGRPKLETTTADMGGLSRASPDVLSLVLDEPYVQSNSPATSTEMLPPLVKHVLALPPNSEHSCPSTVPNTTPTEPSQTDMKASRERSNPKPRSWSSSARMTSPTIPSNSTQEFENATKNNVTANTEEQIKLPEGSENVQMSEEVLLISSAVRPSPPAEGRSQPPVLRTTDPRSTYDPITEVKEELSKPAATDKGSGTSSQPSKGKFRRKTKDDVHTDELGADDSAVGLPKEQYQPRPSRSRAIRADEKFLLAVDFSKRPEAVAKAKIRRRKTTGGHIPTREEVTFETISEICDDEPIALEKKKNRRTATDDHKPPQGVADIVDLPHYDADRTEMHGEAKVTLLPTEKSQLEEHMDVVDAHKGNDIDEAANTVQNTEEPKKKRGRPRKIPTEELPSLQDLSHDQTPTAPATTAEKPTKPAPAKKPAQRRKINDTTTTTTTTQLSAGFVLSDADEEHNLRADDDDDASHDPSPLPPASPPRPPPPPAPVQTPQKAASRGPDKHSPLNSGKVPYRVGLSKRARIEPLLRIVRK